MNKNIWLTKLNIELGLEKAKAKAIESLNNNQCLRSSYGAVIFCINEEGLIRRIFNGETHTPIHLKPCKECYRKTNNIQSGTRYERCKSIHAEQDAILKMGNNYNHDFKVMFLYGIDVNNLKPLKVVRPCNICMKFILDADIDYIITPSFQGTVLELLNKNENGEYDSLL